MPVHLLARIPFFADLPLEELDRLVAEMAVVKLHSGDLLFREGDIGEHMYVVVDGELEILMAPETDDELILNIVQAGEYLGEMSFIMPGGQRTASVRARGDVTLLSMSRMEFNELLERQPQLRNAMNAMVRLLSERLDNPPHLEQIPTLRDKQPSHTSDQQQNKPQMDPKSLNPRKEANLGQIFISYRRSDSADIAGRIYDRLVGKFGKEPIFKDVDSIPLGLDFKEYLDQKVGECDVLLVIIGDRWLDASDSAGKSRLHEPADFVRIEIQSALERGIPVIPLLVRGAQMPVKESLPTSLRKLVFRNGQLIRPDPDFHRDMDRLIAALEKYVHKEK